MLQMLPSIFYILVWVPIGIWIMSMLNFAIQGDIEGLPATVAIVIGIVIGIMTMAPPVPWLRPLFLALAFFMLIIFPYLRKLLEQKEMAQIDADYVRSAYEILSQNPNNLGPQLRIAKVIYSKGHVGHAVGIAEGALKGVPENMFEEELRQLRQWKQVVEHQLDHGRPLKCPECGYLNPPGMVFCKNCHGWYLVEYAKGSWIGRLAFKRLMTSWVATAFALTGVPIAVALFDGVSALMGSMLVVSGSLMLILYAFRPPQYRATV